MNPHSAGVSLLNLIQPLCQGLGGGIAVYGGHDGLAAQVDGAVSVFCRLFIFSMVIGGGQVTHDEVFPFGAAHVSGRGGGDEFFAVDFQGICIFFQGDMFFGKCGEPLFIGVSPLAVGGVVGGGENFLGEGGVVVTVFFYDPLLHGGGGAGVVAGTVDVVEG